MESKMTQNRNSMKMAIDLKEGMYIKTAYNKVKIIRIESSKGWIKIWYECMNGFRPSKPWNFRFSQPIQTTI